MNKMKNIKLMNIYTNSLNLSIMLTLTLSTFMVINSSSWLNSWIFLEMNTLTFIPLMINKSYQNKSTNSMIKYFIVQSFSSSFLFLSFILMNFFMMNENYQMNPNISYILKIIISTALLIKLGAAPFHWWLPHIMIKLNWKSCFLLLTWQKIAPLIIICQMNNNNMLMNVCALMSMTIGALMGLNQSSIKLLLTYSSINHIGWIIINSLLNKFLMMFYLMIYSLMNLIICIMMNNMNILYINQMFKNYNKNLFNMMFLLMMFLSLGGLPPFIGFLPKMYTLIMTIKNMMFLELIIMLITTLITLKFYMNLMMPMMNMYNLKMKFSKSNLYMNKIYYSLIINMIISFIIMTLINFTP